MQDIRQIKIINQSLNKEREKYLFELTKVNASIAKKVETINKMLAYHDEYYKSENLKLTHTTPALNKNLDLFAKKIKVVVKQAEDDVKRMNTAKETILSKLEAIDK